VWLKLAQASPIRCSRQFRRQRLTFASIAAKSDDLAQAGRGQLAPQVVIQMVTSCAPGIGTIHDVSASSHASAICAGVMVSGSAAERFSRG
jgi:hypothetical protein